MAIGSLSGGNLLTAAAEMLSVNTTLTGYDSSNAAVLLKQYLRYESYFRGMVALQIKATALMQNAYNAVGEQNLAVQFSEYLPDYLRRYAMSFLEGVERLVATYHHDATLLDMFMGDPQNDPLRAAQRFIQRYPSVTGPRLWLWHGSGATFNNARGVGMEQGQDLNLPKVIEVNQFVRANESPQASYGLDRDSWTVARFAFAPNESGTFSLWESDTSSVNATFDPSQNPPLRASSTLHLSAGSYTVMTAVTSAGFTEAGYLGIDERGPLIPEDSEFTMECWAFIGMRFGTVFSADRLYNGGGGDYQNRGWRIHIDDDWSVKFGRFTAGGETIGLIHSGLLTQAVWHHFAITYARRKATYYVDGESKGATEFTMAPIVPILGATLIDNKYAGLKFSGLMNEFRIWNRALGGDEIAGNLHRTINSGPGLVAAYGFDRGTLNDRSGQQPPLTAHGTVGFRVMRTRTGMPHWLS